MPTPGERMRAVLDRNRGDGVSRPRNAGALWLFALGIVGVALIALILLIGWIGGYDKTNGGEIAVVRNGGLFDNHKIRQVVSPASGLIYTGMWSDVHKYPAQQ